MNSMMRRITLRGLLLGACIVSFGLPALVASAGNNPPPGTVTTWGQGTYRPIPVVFPAGVVPVSISAYEYAGGFAITEDGSLYEWFGVTNAVPKRITFPSAVTEVKAVSMRYAHVLALTNDGLYAWGQNSHGQVGDGTTISRSIPVKVIFPPAVTSVTEIAAGYSHSLAMTDDGLYAWGDNFNGELGDGTRIDRSLPVKVALPPTVSTVIQVAAGRNDSYAIANDGLYAWGSDFAGQLGNGSFGKLPDGSSDAGQTLPVKVLFPVGNKGSPIVTSISEIAAGEYYALAITNDGVYAWGMDLSGCLGTLTGTIALPVKVKFPKAVTTAWRSRRPPATAWRLPTMVCTRGAVTPRANWAATSSTR
jgi:regulator of chromosome condensation (RCC1) repeat-containing protein